MSDDKRCECGGRLLWTQYNARPICIRCGKRVKVERAVKREAVRQ